MPKVLVTPPMLAGQQGRFRELLEQAGCEVVFPPHGFAGTDRQQLQDALIGIDAILASVEPLSRDVLAASQLRVIARNGVGFDSVDIAAATELGIVVTITPGSVEVSAAEHTIALLLCLTRGLIPRDRAVRTGDWSRSALPRLAGKTMGIVGLGRIGRQVAKRAMGLDMRVIAADPQPDFNFAFRYNIELCEFEDLLAAADVVSLHLPATSQTLDLIDARALARMRPGAILVNTSRGSLVDESALCEALSNGRLFGAALDVFKSEPLPLDSPLLQRKNVVLCPHLGGLDEHSEQHMSSTAAQCIVDLLKGRWPEACVVNQELRGQWQW